MSELKPIPPSVGRQVHFHMASPDVSHIKGWVTTPDNTYAATVALVHNKRLVNLAVYDGSGYLYPMQSIPLCQPGDERPLGNWCEWPAHVAAMSQPPGRMPLMPPIAEPPVLNTPAPAGVDLQALSESMAEPVTHMGSLKLHEPGQVGPVDTLRIAASGLDMIATELALGIASVENVQQKLRLLPPLIMSVIDNLSKPVDTKSRGEKFAEALGLRERQAAEAATRFDSDPDRERAILESQAQSRRAEEKRANDLIRHPVIGAAQELDNEGSAADGGVAGIAVAAGEECKVTDCKIIGTNTVTGDGSGQALPEIRADREPQFACGTAPECFDLDAADATKGDARNKTAPDDPGHTAYDRADSERRSAEPDELPQIAPDDIPF